jgi:hypothetical protein
VWPQVLITTEYFLVDCLQIMFDAFDHQDVTDYVRLRMFNSTDPLRKTPIAEDSQYKQRKKHREYQLKTKALASSKTIKRQSSVKTLLDSSGSLPALTSRVNALRSGDDLRAGGGANRPRAALRFEAIEAYGHPLLEVAETILQVRTRTKQSRAELLVFLGFAGLLHVLL